MSHRKISKNQKIFFLVSASVILIFFIFWGGESARSFFINFFGGIQEKIWIRSQNKSSLFFGLVNGLGIQMENESLKKENQSLLFQLNQCGSLGEENQELRTLLSLRPNKKFEYVDAQISGRSIDGEAVFINKGLKDKIQEGQAVINREHVFVGRIEKVYEQNSLVRLLADPSFKINVEIGAAKIESIAKGGSFLSLELPKEKEIEKGALVITGKLQKEIPHGLLVGKILNIRKTDLNSFQQLEIKPFVASKELKRLFVIISF